MSKKIIIISEYFAPQNAIAAIRMSKIVKYINRNNDYEILVIANDYEDYDDEILKKDVERKANIVRIKKSKTLDSIYSLLKKRRNKIIVEDTDNKQTNKSKNNNSFIVGIKQTMFYLLEIANTMTFKFRAMKYLRKFDLGEYTHMISTFGPLSCHLVAKKVKRIYPNIRWIADFRDPVLNIFTPIGFKSYAKNYAKLVTKKADVVVAVSSGYMDALFLNKDKNKCVITNGYDKEDLINVNVKYRTTNKLIFTYTGNLYSGQRDLSTLFKAICELINEEKISVNNIQVQYAGTSGVDIINQAQMFGMESIVSDFGYISRKEAIDLQLNSDILLLATWNTNRGLGNIPGKFLEYMMMDKPIICVTTGEISGSEVKGIIKTSNLGFCYEEANKERDFAQLKNYIYDLYKNKIIEGKSIPFSPNKEIVESYSYEHKAKEFENLL
jgi:glycosyltransferase involved in cell wall biosynthesis